jgi:hypothetical protein
MISLSCRDRLSRRDSNPQYIRKSFLMRLQLNVRYRACLLSNFPTPRAIYEKYMVSGFEPLNTNFSHFWIYIIVKAFTFPRESNPNINKNRRERFL